MSLVPARSRVLVGAALCVGLMLPALGFGVAIGQASPLPAQMDDPAPPPPAPDPSTIINEANTILPMLGRFLPSFLNPNAALPAPANGGFLQTPANGGFLQPPMLSPFAPSG